jgi:ATP-dependent HslUV protease ATP-binding subunit HslU
MRMNDLTPQQIVRELDRYIVGQTEAKRMVAIALRNRYRRLALPREMQAEITPKNMLMIGPTGVGKSEIARRLARLADAPFIKVEATKFTQVGYVGRDVESIIRDLMEAAVTMVHEERTATVREQAAKVAEERIVTLLIEQQRGAESAAAPRPLPRLAAQPAQSQMQSAQSAGGAAPSRASAAAPAAQRRTSRTAKQLRKALTDQLARHELDEQLIEIELETEESVATMFEFVAGVSGEELGDGLQDFLGTMPSTRKRTKQVSVKEARKLLTQEEANKLVDVDEVVERATQRVEQSGVIFLDELDKIVGSKVDTGPDVSGEGVQRDLLPIVEGSTVMTRFGPVKTDHVLWIAAGAFHHAKPSDLIPELQGRLPLRVELTALGVEEYRAILTQPENALTRQYEALLGVEQVTLRFTDEGLDEIARSAHLMNERVENIGARRLQTITERVLDEVSFAAPEMAGQTVTIDAAYVRERLGKLLADEDLSRYIL